MSKVKSIQDPPIARFLFQNTKMAWFWLFVRLYVGWIWLMSGWGKIFSSAWTGDQAGSAVMGFTQGALSKATGERPDVQGWYAWFLENFIMEYPELWSYAIAWGELFVGIALIAGAFVGIAAFFGMFMNINFLFAGTLSSNPVMLILSILLVLSWKTAGYIGLDRYLLPWLGTPWQPGKIKGN